MGVNHDLDEHQYSKYDHHDGIGNPGEPLREFEIWRVTECAKSKYRYDGLGTGPGREPKAAM